MSKILFYLLIISALISGGGAECLAAEGANNPDVRVCIIDNKHGISLALKGGYRIYTMDNQRILMEGPSLEADIIAGKDGIRVGQKEIKESGVKIKVSEDSSVYVNGRRFRGDIEILKKDGQNLMVVNIVPVELYLYGVLYREVSFRWPDELLMAQAIAARSFALFQARQNKLTPYDLRSDIYSQVYGGSGQEKSSTNKAVDMTRGKVLSYHGDILPAYYHATCAGFTENAATLWNVDLPPLKGVKCDYCRNSPHYKWAKWIPLWKLDIILRNAGYKVGSINYVNIMSKDASKRVDKIELKGANGVSVILTGKEFRQVIGPNELRSTNFNVTIKWGQLIISGFGWGHGVGMCQWGACEMARQGKKAEEILAYYYPGAEITTLDKIKQ